MGDIAYGLQEVSFNSIPAEAGSVNIVDLYFPYGLVINDWINGEAGVIAESNEGFIFSHWEVNSNEIMHNESTLDITFRAWTGPLQMIVPPISNTVTAVFVEDENYSDDLDGDGVVNSEDAFPNDPSEWKDTDNDGIGNNSDTDDDDDSLSDVKEAQFGSDPLVAETYDSLIEIINSIDLSSLGGVAQSTYNSVVAERDARLTLDQVKDLRAGSKMIEINNGQATLTMDVEESDDLGAWTNGSTTSIQIPIDAEAGKKFFRFKMAD